MKILQIIQSAWRCTLEEQDDPAVWIVHAMKGAGAELGVLLRGNAIGYALEGQDASGLRFGELEQKNPPRLDRDVASLAAKGIDVWAIEEDARERGIDPSGFVPGVRVLPRAQLPSLMAEYDRVWHW